MEGETWGTMARQLGLITRAQARAAGLTRHQIQRRVASGAWLRVHAGVYRNAARARSHDQRLLAAVLALGPGAAISHRAAVGVWGLYGYKPQVIEVSRPTSIKHPIAGVTAHEARDLEPWHVTRRGPLPVTTPARTLVDLGAVAPAHLVTKCMEEWLSDRVVMIDALRAAAQEHAGRGRKGVGVLRTVFGERVLGDLVADSGAEALLARVLADRSIAAPVHHKTTTAGRSISAELDYAYPAQRIAIEVDGYGVHLRSRETFEHDRDRQNELEIAGWRVLRFTSRALRSEPDRVAGQVRRMLADDGRR